jgi:fructokinase
MPMLGAIEAGGTKIVCAVSDNPGALFERTEIATTVPQETFDRVLAFFATRLPLDAIGVASFGPLDIDPQSERYGSILETPKPGWAQFSLKKALAPLRIPAIFDTDVNGAALAEYWAAGGASRVLAYVTVGTGVGVGIVKDGCAMSGVHHYEMGHLRPPRDREIDPFAGSCPFHGDCIEGLASGAAIVKRWGAPLSQLADREADLVAAYLAELAHSIILTHMPDRIVFGGGVMKSPGLLERLRNKARKLLNAYIQAPALRGDWSSFIVRPALGDNAGITGALLLAASAAMSAKK